MEYVLTNCTLLDGTATMQPRPDTAVVVKDGKIASICATSEIPAGVETIDLQGKYLLPGMINLHVHLPGSGKPVSVGFLPKAPAEGETLSFVQSRLYKSMQKGLLNKLI